MLNLDTHILLYALSDQLSKKEKKVISQNNWGISSIVIWEISKLSQLGRINIDTHSSKFQRVISEIHVWQINLNICRKLDSLDFNSDPADELIAATSLEYNLPLVTRDKTIRKSKILDFAC